MRKIVKKQGTSLVIIIDTEMKKAYNIEEGDVIDVRISKIPELLKGGEEDENK